MNLFRKYIFFALLIFSSILMLYGCKCYCQKAVADGIRFPNDTVSTSITISTYARGSNFSMPVKNDTVILLNHSGATFRFSFNFDYLIMKYPSGNTYKITNLSSGNASQPSSITGGCGDVCYTGLYYSVNDSNYRIEPTTYSGVSGIVIN